VSHMALCKVPVHACGHMYCRYATAEVLQQQAEGRGGDLNDVMSR
jgi:hypothetical protein